MLSAERRLEIANEKAYGHVTREEMAGAVITGLLNTCYDLIWRIKSSPALPRSDEMMGWVEELESESSYVRGFAKAQEEIEKTDPTNPYYIGK